MVVSRPREQSRDSWPIISIGTTSRCMHPCRNISMIVIAHRGFSSRYPENTLPAIRAALRLGVAMIEIDVQQTRDGRLIVFHDYRLDRVCGVRARVRDKTLRQI